MNIKPKLIAISQRNDLNRHGDLIDNLENNYVNYYEQFGIRFLVIPNSTSDIEYYLKQFPLDGMLLTGGNTINPELYGKKRDPEDNTVSDFRDGTEKKMLDYAVAHKLPLLGVCRGFQFINVYFGGTLFDNLREHLPGALKHVAAVHDITLTDSSLSSVFGDTVKVNSYHNQGVTSAELASPLRTFAQSSDGCLEGLFHPDLPIAAIEWHPERKSPDEKFNVYLLRAFVNRELYWKPSKDGSK